MVKPIAESSVICLPCKEDIRRNVGNPTYTPRWKDSEDKCMVVSCQWENVCKIKSKLASAERVAELLDCDLHESHHHSLDCEERQSQSQSLDYEERESHCQSLDCVVRESHCQYVTLCQVHYKQLHRKLHQNDNTYVRQKCKLCNKAIKQVRHIAMPAHVNSIYSGISDSIALHPHDPVCLTCYKAHMSLSEDDISTDKDLIEISQSIKQMSVDNDNLSDFVKHIALALIHVFNHVCIILLDSSATLVKNVYHTFVQKSIEFAESYGLGTLSVNDIKATFSQKNLITQLVIIFHKHIVFLTKAKKWEQLFTGQVQTLVIH